MAGIREQIRKLILRAQTDGVPQARESVKSLRSEVSGLKDAWSVLGKVAAAVGVTLTAAAAVKATADMAKSLVSTGREMENIRVRISAIARDEERAARIMQLIISESERTPFQIKGIAEAAAQLELLDVNAEAILPRLSDVAAVTGQNLEEVSARFVAAMQGQTRGLQQLGITRAEIERELGRPITEGEGFQNQKEIVEALVRIMDRDFAGGIERTRDRWDVMVSDMGTSFDTIKRKVAEGGFFKTIEDDFGHVNDLVNRFVEQGGADAIALGFNNAWTEIHKAFFAPFFSNLDELDVNATVIAASVEKTFLSMAASTGEAIAILRLGASGLAGTGELFKALLTFDAEEAAKWKTYLSETLPRAGAEAQVRIAGLRGRVDDLNKALELLAQTGGEVTPEIEKLLGFGDVKDKKSKVPFDKDAPLLRDTGKTIGEGILFGIRDSNFEKAAGEMAIRFGGAFNDAMEGATFRAPMLGEDERDTGTIGVDSDRLQQELDSGLDQWAGYYGMIAQFDEDLSQEQIANREATMREAVEITREAFQRMGEYNDIFARRGQNLGRALNAFLVRSGAETLKALIEFKIRDAKLEAEIAAAKALIAIGSGNIAGGVRMLAGAAKLFAIVGGAGIAESLIEARAVAAEEKIIGTGTGPGVEFQGSGPGGRFKGTASSVRVGAQVNNFYVSINKTAGRDIVEGDTGITDAQELQRLFDEGIIQVPQRS